jgi:hypothetical protein
MSSNNPLDVLFINTKNSANQENEKEMVFSGIVEVLHNANSIVVNVPNTCTGDRIGVPTGGVFGTTNPADLNATDTIADGFSKVSLYLERLTPSPPPQLGTLIIGFSQAIYNAYIASSPYSLVANVLNDPFNKPSFTVSNFGNADSGILSAFVRNSVSVATNQGSVSLTSGDNVGIYGNFLEITDDSAFNPFYNKLTAVIGGVNVAGSFPPSTIDYSVQLRHSSSGNTNVLSFYQDDAYTTSPIAMFGAITNIIGTTAVVSGVTVFTGTSGFVTGEVTAVNCVKKFYNANWVGRMTAPGIDDSFAMPIGGDRNEGSIPVLTFNSAFSATEFYNNNFIATFTVQNSAGSTSSVTGVFANGPIIFDGISTLPSSGTFANETTRNKSYSGLYPIPTIDAFDPTESLALNFELQLINGMYQYPPAIDYSAYVPSSVDYSSLTSDSSYRYYTQLMDPITDESFYEFTIINATGFTSIIDPDIILQLSVVGSTGWLDANAIYEGVGAPLNDGDKALDFSLSTTSIKRVTFGGALYSGFVLIRIGLKDTSTQSFSGFI